MKKLLLVTAFSGILVSGILKSQTLCDSLQIDSVQVQGSNLWIFYSNQSQQTIIYPFVVAALTPNPYLALSGSAAFSSYLDIAGGSNNGVTQFGPTLTTVSPANMVPLNTVFSGVATLYDPNDSSFICMTQFSFTYGTMSGNGIGEVGSPSISISVYPNPASMFLNVNINTGLEQETNLTITNILGEVVFTIQHITNESGNNTLMIDTEHLSSGVYCVNVEGDGARGTQKFIKE